MLAIICILKYYVIEGVVDLLGDILEEDGCAILDGAFHDEGDFVGVHVLAEYLDVGLAGGLLDPGVGLQLGVDHEAPSLAGLHDDGVVDAEAVVGQLLLVDPLAHRVGVHQTLLKREVAGHLHVLLGQLGPPLVHGLVAQAQRERAQIRYHARTHQDVAHQETELLSELTLLLGPRDLLALQPHDQLLSPVQLLLAGLHLLLHRLLLRHCSIKCLLKRIK